jgi:cytochrome c biogenesis protein ResB
MTSPLRRATNWLASPKLAASLLLIVGAWSFLGTLAVQGEMNDPKVIAWATTHPLAEKVVSVLGLHQAFT